MPEIFSRPASEKQFVYLVSEKGNIVFDIGTSVLASEKDCKTLLKGSSALGDSPTLFISHWDIDHYSLLKYVSDEEIRGLCCAFVPSECVSLTSKNIARRLEKHCGYLRPIKPFTEDMKKAYE